MRSGLESTSNRNYGAWVQSRNWVQHALDRPLSPSRARRWTTAPATPTCCRRFSRKATGKSTWQFANEALAEPLGFTLAQWPHDPQGIYFGGNDMLMTPRQMLAFGELYLNRGRVEGTAGGSRVWVDASFVPRARSRWSDQVYGYGWWMRELGGQHVRYAWGFGGQYIFVVPNLDLVVVDDLVRTVDESRRSHRRNVFDIVEQLVIEPDRRTRRWI